MFLGTDTRLFSRDSRTTAAAARPLASFPHFSYWPAVPAHIAVLLLPSALSFACEEAVTVAAARKR